MSFDGARIFRFSVELSVRTRETKDASWLRVVPFVRLHELRASLFLNSIVFLSALITLKCLGLEDCQLVCVWEPLWSHLLPLGAALYLLESSLSKILSTGADTVIAYFVGAAGTVLGTVVAWVLVGETPSIAFSRSRSTLPMAPPSHSRSNSRVPLCASGAGGLEGGGGTVSPPIV